MGCIVDDAGNGQKRKLELTARTASSFLPDKTSSVQEVMKQPVPCIYSD